MILSLWWQLLVSAAAGAALGVIFFWGLWETVKRLSNSSHPAVWMLASMSIRFALVLAGFYVMARYGGWEHLLAGLIGFTLPRLVMTRRLQRLSNQSKPEKVS
jgi:F1F0 ATPase subunit 2